VANLLTNKYSPAVLLLATLLAACSGKPYVVTYSGDIDAPKTNTLYIARHEWHTGFIISAIDADSILPFLRQRFSSAAYYEFGWGDTGFYQADKITSMLSLKAIFWPTDSVMHVVAVPFDPPRYFNTSEVIEIHLSDPELYNLLEFIRTSFYYAANEQPISMKHGIYGNSQFYRGEGDYFLFNTCNRWTAKGLESAGFDIFTFSKFTADSIMGFLRDQTEPSDLIAD